MAFAQIQAQPATDVASNLQNEVNTGGIFWGLITMDSFRLNQIAMVFLGTVFFLFSLSILSESLFHSKKPEKEGYAIEVAGSSEGEGDKAQSDAPAYDPIEPLLASADMDAGAAVFKKCQSCHTYEKGGAKKVGPNLYNIVGGPIAADAEFKYSAALKEYAEGKSWTYEELNGFLFKPKKHVKGTAMGFAGVKKTADRANLVGWLRQFADSPAALP